MRKDKMSAITLRMQGKSYREIVKIAGIPKSTLFEWFHGENWSLKIKEKLRLQNEKRGAEALNYYRAKRKLSIEKEKRQARKEAGIQFKKLQKNPLFIAGIMLYWGEGDKSLKYNQVRLSNSDADLLKVYLSFLRTICKIPEEKIKAWILLYPDLDSGACLTFWRKNLKMSQSQFIKPTVIQGRHKEKKLVNGVCTIYTSFPLLKVRILEWIKLSAGIV